MSDTVHARAARDIIVRNVGPARPTPAILLFIALMSSVDSPAAVWRGSEDVGGMWGWGWGGETTLLSTLRPEIKTPTHLPPPRVSHSSGHRLSVAGHVTLPRRIDWAVTPPFLARLCPSVGVASVVLSARRRGV